MVSPELIRRYSFFGGITSEHIKDIAMLGEEQEIAKDEVLFETGDEIDELFLLEDGELGLFIQATNRNVEHNVSAQLMGTVQTEGVLVSTAGPGEVVGWSSLVPPHEATATVKALADSHVIVLSGPKMRELFEKDRNFECKMIRKVAQVIRQRLKDRQIELLASKTT